MTTSRVLKWVSGGIEAFLGIPFFGGMFIISLLWTPLVIMLGLHIVTLIVSRDDGVTSTGSILGIITSCVGWIPIVGMIMHIITAIFLMTDASRKGTPLTN
jgi:hypothetical protein